MFCNHHQNDWNKLLPSAEFVAANHVHSLEWELQVSGIAGIVSA